MAGRGNPSFLKNQKAKKRTEKANEKRAARQVRNAEKAAARERVKNGLDPLLPGEPNGADGTDAPDEEGGDPATPDEPGA
jgi:hypothetical protein